MMMKKLKSKGGFTLMELMLGLMITVFLVMGIGAGMTSGMRVYQEANFEADSATLAGILNTNLGDLLRYSENIQRNDGTVELVDSDGNVLKPEQASFIFTNLDYGVQNAYFHIDQRGAEGDEEEAGGDENAANAAGVLQLRNLNNSVAMELVNSGAYPNLLISDLKITYESQTAGEGYQAGYFNVEYKIVNRHNRNLVRDVQYIVRLLNA